MMPDILRATLCWPAPAKLNLFLYVTGRRPDGYHNLQTLFQFLDYGDTLTITARDDGQIRLLTPLPGVPDESNLVVRAARLLRDALPTTFARAGADIAVDKVLPMGGGLGGGSSDAATVMLALNTLWRAGLSDETLAGLGLKLGADVPVFIKGYAAFAEGVGEMLHPAHPEEKWYLVAHPGVSIATPDIFGDPALKRDSPVRTLSELLHVPYTNDCEPVARKRFREVEELLSWLLEYAPSRLTGTGACVFAEFDTEAAARQVLSYAPERVQGFVARGVNTSPLHLARSALSGTLQ